MHVEHYKMADVKRLANEWSRDSSYKCRDGRIDASRTRNNYVLENTARYGMYSRKTLGFTKVLSGRLGEVPHSSRKDLNVLSDWVVTCPQELVGDPVKEQRFFDLTYQYMQGRYGKENVIQGFVHMDETTPHVHIPIVPVKDGRVSSKALFTKGELREVHKELDKVMEKEFHIKGLVKNGRTKGNLTVDELKERTRQERELAARKLELDAREQALNAREQAVTAREAAVAASEASLSDFEARVGEITYGALEAVRTASKARVNEIFQETKKQVASEKRKVGFRRYSSTVLQDGGSCTTGLREVSRNRGDETQLET